MPSGKVYDCVLCFCINQPTQSKNGIKELVLFNIQLSPDPMMFNRIYYIVKPFIPRRLQIVIRRAIARRKLKTVGHIWPIYPGSEKKPPDWPGWPDNKKFAVILTHDVDTQRGHDNCLKLAEIEQELGFKSSFNFVPERYEVSPSIRAKLQNMGFEIGVHGLNHDGKLYSSREEFSKRAAKINKYLHEWNSVGFRSPSMHHNLDWIHDLDIQYDASTFDTDPFEPQSDGVHTIFPFWVTDSENRNKYLELPYTLAQDFTVYILLNKNDIEIWKKKLDWVAANCGMVLLNTHPDYINFFQNDRKRIGLQEYPFKYYEDFLLYIKKHHNDQFCNVLPSILFNHFNSICNQEI